MQTKTITTPAELRALGADHLLRCGPGRQDAYAITRGPNTRMAQTVLIAQPGASALYRSPGEAMDQWGPFTVIARPGCAAHTVREKAVELLATTGVVDTIFVDRASWLPMAREDATAAVELLDQHGLLA